MLEMELDQYKAAVAAWAAWRKAAANVEHLALALNVNGFYNIDHWEAAIASMAQAWKEAERRLDQAAEQLGM
jgi:hypothetical protein